MPAASVGETADMAGLATCSTSGKSSQDEKIPWTCSTGHRDVEVATSELFAERP